MNTRVKTLLDMFSNRGIEVLVDMVKVRLHNESFDRFLKNVHFSESRGGLVVPGYNLCVESCGEQRNFTCDKTELRNRAHSVFACDRF